MDEFVAVVGLPQLESGLHGGEGLVPPLGESGRGDLELPAECVEGLALEESQDDLGLSPRNVSIPLRHFGLRRFTPAGVVSVGLWW
jgi:hypothetical protein